MFKDELTLEEWELEFLNEDIEEVNKLYLAICEMEYFPMECKMTGHFRNDIVKKQKILIVESFEISHSRMWMNKKIIESSTVNKASQII